MHKGLIMNCTSLLKVSAVIVHSGASGLHEGVKFISDLSVALIYIFGDELKKNKTLHKRYLQK